MVTAGRKSLKVLGGEEWSWLVPQRAHTGRPLANFTGLDGAAC